MTRSLKKGNLPFSRWMSEVASTGIKVSCLTIFFLILERICYVASTGLSGLPTDEKNSPKGICRGC